MKGNGKVASGRFASCGEDKASRGDLNLEAIRKALIEMKAQVAAICARLDACVKE